MNLTKHWAATLDDYVIDLAWSPDGATLAAASAAGPVHLFAAAEGAKQHELPGHENGTNCLAWQSVAQEAGIRSQEPGDGKTSPPSPIPWPTVLATGGQDGCVKFWDAANGQHTTTAKLGPAWVEHLAWRPAPVDAATATPVPASEISNSKFQFSPLLAATPSGNPHSTLRTPHSPLLAATSGRTLAFLRPDGSVAHTCPAAPKTISSLAWQPAGGCVAAAAFGGVRLWDADDFILQKEFPYANGILALVWSPDGRWLVSGNQDPSVHLWLPEKNDELHMSGYENKVTTLSYDCASRWLATGGGHDACIWDCSGAGPEGREPLMFPHDAKVCAVAFQHTHGLLATASADGVVMLWSPERPQPLRATVKLPAPATKLAWSPDDRLLALGTERGALYVLRCDV